MIPISIIIPVYNSSRDLFESLSALRSQTLLDAEIIVVDDGSTDDPGPVAQKMGAQFLRMPRNSGPAAARNYGARQAQGEILFFIDADVVIRPGMVSHIVSFFKQHPDVAAVFGSYDATPRAEGIVSQYRNLLHHFVHQNGDPEASTFWAGCGAIRRAVFEAIGGFDQENFPRASIEDIELGYRLRQAGHRILFDKTLQGTHLKRWTLGSILRTDIFCRAIPWTRLILERKNLPNNLNLKVGQRMSAVFVMLAGICFILGFYRLEFIIPGLLALVGVILLNRSFYAFLLRQRGLRFTLAAIPLHLFYYVYSMVSYGYVLAEFQWRHLRKALLNSLLSNSK
jgi:glycosyltransferase involved in cell wall biosynthesis